MQMSKITEIIKKSKLFQGFSRTECEEIEKRCMPTFRQLDAGDLWTYEDERLENFAIIISGRLAGEKYHYEGTVDLVEVYSQGDLLGIDTVSTPSRKSPLQVTCIKNAEILVFSYDKLKNHPSLSKELHAKLMDNIILILANENMKKLYKIDVLYKRALRERILVFLRHMEAKRGSNKFRIDMDREQFSQYLGVNRSALSHELSLMRSEGLISFKKDYFEMLK